MTEQIPKLDIPTLNFLLKIIEEESNELIEKVYSNVKYGELSLSVCYYTKERGVAELKTEVQNLLDAHYEGKRGRRSQALNQDVATLEYVYDIASRKIEKHTPTMQELFKKEEGMAAMTIHYRIEGFRHITRRINSVIKEQMEA